MNKQEQIKLLNLALKILQTKRPFTAGLGSCIQILKDVIESMGKSKIDDNIDDTSGKYY